MGRDSRSCAWWKMLCRNNMTRGALDVRCAVLHACRELVGFSRTPTHHFDELHEIIDVGPWVFRVPC